MKHMYSRENSHQHRKTSESMDRWILITLGILLGNIGIVTGVYYPVKIGSSCIGGSGVSMYCKADKLWVLGAFYGNNSGRSDLQCVNAPSDCTYTDEAIMKEVASDCTGTNYCNPQPTARFLDNCGTGADYLQAKYACVSAVDIDYVCKSVNVTQQEGFLSSLDYPNSMDTSNNMCNCTLTSTGPLALTVLDLSYSVSSTESGKELKLHINYNTTEETIVGGNNFKPNSTVATTTHPISLQVMNNGVRAGRMWLHYKVLDGGFVQVVCYPPPSMLPTTQPTPKSTVLPASTTPSPSTTKATKAATIDITIIVGAVLGGLLFIGLIIFIIVVVKLIRKRIYKMKENEELALDTDVTGPAPVNKDQTFTYDVKKMTENGNYQEPKDTYDSMADLTMVKVNHEKSTLSLNNHTHNAIPESNHIYDNVIS